MTQPGHRSAPRRSSSLLTAPHCNHCCVGVIPGPSADVAAPLPEPVSLAGVVLAGGASRRMGRDKATMPVPENIVGSTGRTTMVEHVISVVGQRCEPVFVVAAPGQPLPALQASVVRDEVRGLGPLLATGRGLRAAAEVGAKWAFVCAVDMPFLTADLIDAL